MSDDETNHDATNTSTLPPPGEDGPPSTMPPARNAPSETAVEYGLKPCLHCGSLDLMFLGDEATNEESSDVWVHCEDCSAEGPVATIGCRDEDEDGPIDLGKEAAELWNKRLDLASEDEKRAYRAMRTVHALVTGIVPVQALLSYLDERKGFVGHVDFGPAAATVEQRAAILLRSLVSSRELRPEEIDALDLTIERSKP